MWSLSLLIKPASGSCNLRCTYCFYADEPGQCGAHSRGMMSPETLEIIVKRALSEATELVSFGFQGGEPMLAGLPFYRELIGFQQKYNVNQVQILNSIQTNGTLIDMEWAQFFANHHFLVGLSIDGPKDVHDALRRDAQGRGTHARCMKAAERLRRAGAQFNVLTVVSGPLAERPSDAYNFYKKRGFHFVQLIPCMDEIGALPAAYSLSPQAYGRFLCRFFDLWYADYVRGVYYSVRAFDNWIRMLLGEPPENCGMSGRCHGYPVIEADGSVYPCDFYVEEIHQLGNVNDHSFQEMLSSEVCQQFELPSHQRDERCMGCEYVALCRGGCRRDREPILDGTLALNRYCESYKLFFAHAFHRMQAIAMRLSIH